MNVLIPMGEGEPEAFRCRVYGEAPKVNAERIAFLDALASDDGVIDSPAIDAWIAPLEARGWLTFEMVPHPTEPGAKAKIWRFTDYMRGEWPLMKASML